MYFGGCSPMKYCHLVPFLLITYIDTDTYMHVCLCTFLQMMLTGWR